MGAVLVVLMSCCYARDMAKFVNHLHAHETSSTLEWHDMKKGQEPVKGSVPINEADDPVWCRAQQTANWIPGAVIDGTCHFPHLSKIYKKENYEVLVSFNDSSRIKKVSWDRFEAYPSNRIVSPKMILAIFETDEGEVLPGYVDPEQRFGFFIQNGTISRQPSGNILTEDEPVKYLVDHIVKDTEKAQEKMTEEIMATGELRNSEAEKQEVGKDVDYTVEESMYWGRVAGTVVGRPATVTDPSGNVKDLTWGIDNMFSRADEQGVKFELPAETAVNFTLIAVMKKYESPYSAKLTAIYEDGEQRSRMIIGLHIHYYVNEMKVFFDRPYYLANDTKVEGDFPTSQILVHSTTTTTTTTTTQSPHTTSDDGEKPISDSLATDDENNTSEEQKGKDGASTTHPAAALSLLTLLLICPLNFVN